MCLRRSPPQPFEAADDPRSASLSGGMAPGLSAKAWWFIYYESSARSLGLPCPPTPTAVLTLFDGLETFKCILKSILQQRGPFPRRDKFTPCEHVAARSSLLYSPQRLDLAVTPLVHLKDFVNMQHRTID